MKNIFQKITLLIFISAITCSNSFAQIPNPDMELWSNLGLGGESPTDWYSSNGDLVPSNVFKDSINIQSGNYSAMLTNVIGIPGTIGCNFPVTSNPVELNGFFKNNFTSADTATIKIILFNNTQAVDSGEMSITSNLSNWTSLSIPLSNTSATVNSITIIITACNQQQNKFWVDNLSFTNPSGINPENDFSISVYPNPFVSQLTVGSMQSAVNTIAIYNALGEIIYSEGRNFNSPINLNSIPPGIYFLEIKNEEKYFIEKIVKQ